MNLYVHFPFCRAKCAYCALHSVAGRNDDERRAYSDEIGRRISELPEVPKTVYFGGGSPGLCPMPKLPASWRETPPEEFTVELNPLDVTAEKLDELRAHGVNRISMGVQSFDDTALLSMNRGHTANDAEEAFHKIRVAGFKNAGIDLIAGWPGTDDASWQATVERAVSLKLDHCSVYTLIREPKTTLDLRVRQGKYVLPSDDAALRQIDIARSILSDAGLLRYEISNYARKGFACRHNLAVWRGEDYLGIGDGAHSRICSERRKEIKDGQVISEKMSQEEDAAERALFALRLPEEGLDLIEAVKRWPILSNKISVWQDTLNAFSIQGITRKCGDGRYTLTTRGLEVCDAVISELL